MSAAQGVRVGRLFDSRDMVLAERGEWHARSHLAAEFGRPWPVRGQPTPGGGVWGAVTWMESFGLVGVTRLKADQYAWWSLARKDERSTERLHLSADSARRSRPSSTHPCPLARRPMSALSPTSGGTAAAWAARRSGRSGRGCTGRGASRRRPPRSVTGFTGRSALCCSRVIKWAYPIFDMTGATSRCRVRHAPLFAEILDYLAEISTATKGLVSADEEAQAGDGSNNVSLVAESHDRFTRHRQACRSRRGMVHVRGRPRIGRAGRRLGHPAHPGAAP